MPALIASIVKEHGLKPVDAAGVARVIDEGARLADDREKLSIEIGRIADIVREADYWSGQAKRKITARQDVARAIDEQIQRADRLRDRAQETINRGIVLVDTEGAKVGQINGLSVLQLGSFSFGRPSRITARVRMGSGRVTDIEREAKLGGPLHSKGVMILWGFLAGRYALDVPLALAATLVFEQSYGGVDGDSASSAELYALLSALVGRADQAVAGRDRLRQPVGRGAGHRRRQREDRGLLRRLPRARPQRAAGRADPEVQRAAPDAARGRGRGGARTGSSPSTRSAPSTRASRSSPASRPASAAPKAAFPAGTVNRLVEDKLKTFAERGRGFAKAGGDAVEPPKETS